MDARSEAWVCGRSLAGIAGSNPAGDKDVSLVSVVWCQEEVSAKGPSPNQRSPTDSCVSECDRGTLKLRPWPSRAVEP